ncbi:MAG TPA: hypothetical protein VIM98_02805 [Dyella sp.]
MAATADDATSGSYVLRYRSSRAEVWRWYWRSWKRKFWKLHALWAVVMVWPLSRMLFPIASPAPMLLSLLISMTLVVCVMACVPQVLFKRGERLLKVDAHGWYSEIGNASGSRSWREVASIQGSGGTVAIVGTNGHAMIVPRRAFSDAVHQERFLSHVLAWHAAAGVKVLPDGLISANKVD